MKPEIRDDRQLRALTGVSTEKFDILEVAFAKALADEKQSIYQNKLKQESVSENLAQAKKANCRQCTKN